MHRRHKGRAIRRVIRNHQSNGKACVDLLSNKCIPSRCRDQPGSIPSRRLSHMVLNTVPRQGRGHNEARASFVSRDKMHKLRANRA
ncbi:hypothetical protein V6N13_057291 [Hibiscus sabdariffa]